MRSNTDRVADIFIILVFCTIIGLKITGVITISWFLLFSPIIILLGLGILLAIGLTIACLLTTLDNKVRKEKENERY